MRPSKQVVATPQPYISVGENYYWVRIYEPLKKDNASTYTNEYHLLEEYYICSNVDDLEEIKREVNRYSSISFDTTQLKYAMPRKNPAPYALVKSSKKEYAEKYYSKFIEGHCVICHSKFNGHNSKFWATGVYDIINPEDAAYCCSSECHNKLMNYFGQYIPPENIEYIERQMCKGSLKGFVYQIYNRKENSYYIGETTAPPFFRWYEHFVQNQKGDIHDLKFSILTKVPNETMVNDYKDEYLKSVEAFWINALYRKGYLMMNEVRPKITNLELNELFQLLYI